MRPVKAMIYETTLLDAEEGIRFRGITFLISKNCFPHHLVATSRY